MVNTYSLYIGMSSSCGKCLRKISTNADSFSSITSVLSGSLPCKHNQRFPHDGPIQPLVARWWKIGEEHMFIGTTVHSATLRSQLTSINNQVYFHNCIKNKIGKLEIQP